MGDASSTKKWAFLAGLVGAGVVTAYAAPKVISALTEKRGKTSMLDDAAENLDRSVGWDRLPLPLALFTLSGLRHVLRAKNLYDTSPPAGALPPVPPPSDERYRTERTIDGTYNDLEDPRMGSTGTRFGRNVPLEYTYPKDVLSPNPRTVSRELLTRHTFIPATTLNVLAAAWLQFMIRDWFSHGRSEKENPWQVPVEPGDWHENPMTILRTPRDRVYPGEEHLPPTYRNTETPWWDASHIYGTSLEFQQQIRTFEGGKLRIARDRLVP
jgi:hypothetical protein